MLINMSKSILNSEDMLFIIYKNKTSKQVGASLSKSEFDSLSQIPY